MEEIEVDTSRSAIAYTSLNLALAGVRGLERSVRQLECSVRQLECHDRACMVIDTVHALHCSFYF